MSTLNLVICSSLLVLLSPNVGVAMVSPPVATLSTQDQLAQKITERLKYERYADEKSNSGHYEDALIPYALAALLSIEELQLTNTMEKAYCAQLTFKSALPDTKLTECGEGPDGHTLCWKSSTVEVTQCAGTKNLCQKISNTWRSLIEKRDILIFKERPCAPAAGTS